MSRLLKGFIFFTAFPCIKIFGSSITVFLFLFLIFSNKKIKLQVFSSKLFILFFTSILISSVFSFFYDEISHPGLFYILKIVSQYFYWVCVALFFKKYFLKLNIIEISKYFFLGIICLIFSFFIFSFKLDFGFLSIDTIFQRNNFVFIILASFPFCLYYVINNIYLKQYLKRITFLFLLVMFLSQGRSGILIFIIEVLCISIILNPNIKKLYKFFLGLVIIGLFFTSTIKNNLESFSYVIEPYNPRIAGFIRQDGESDINQDKSLMIRLMMIDKTIEIFYEYPVLGIGPNMFKYYKAPLNFRSNYDRLDYRDDEYINSRSSHGAYYQVLSEFGIIGLFFILLIIITPILYLLKRLVNNKNGNEVLFLISLLGVSLHLVTVSALTGTITWVIIGVGWNLRNNKSLR